MRRLLPAACALLFSSTGLAQPVAFDSFESGNLSGGSGWRDASWQSNALGSILVHDMDGAPVYDGSYHVRISNRGTYLWRSVDLVSQADLVLSLAYKSTSSANSSRVWIDDGTPRLVLDEIPPDANWRTIEVALEPSEYISGLVIKLGNEGPSKRALLYFDAIEVKPFVPPEPVVVTLSSPANGSTISGVDPTLSWSADNPVDSFHLILDDDYDFSSPILEDPTLPDNTYHAYGLLPNTTYYWKVRGHAAGTWWNWSSTSEFVTSAPAQNSILVQAEDFVSCVDNTPNNADLVYRMDVDADITYDHDPYYYEGYRVHNIEAGESLTYAIDVPTTDVWSITFNGFLNFDLYFDNRLYAGNLGVPVGYTVVDYHANQNMVVSGVPLSAGSHTMKIVANNGANDYNGMQLDYIWFASSTNPPAPLAAPSKPYDDTVPPARPVGYTSPVELYGGLYVDGPHIRSVNTGDIARLRGVALHSSKWFPTIPKNTIYSLAYHEHVQLIRLAMYAEWGTYDDPEMQDYLKAKTLEVINEAIDAGIYLEISYHTHATDFAIGGGAYALERGFFQWLLAQPVVAARPSNLIFGIINEVAASNISWAQVKPYAQDFVNLIRATHPDNVISCGTPYWCQHPQDVIGSELTGGNVVYTFHMYTASHAMSMADNVVACYDSGLPVWANEISPGSYDWTSWQYDFSNYDNLVATLESRGLGWVNWNWSVKGEALAALNWNSQYYGPWQASDFTDGGLYIRDKLDDPWPVVTTTKMDVYALSASCVVAGPLLQIKFVGSVVDEQLRNVPGASVDYAITGGGGTTTTDAGGVFSISTPKTKKSTSATFTVQGLSLSGYQDDDAIFPQSRTVSLTCP